MYRCSFLQWILFVAIIFNVKGQDQTQQQQQVPEQQQGQQEAQKTQQALPAVQVQNVDVDDNSRRLGQGNYPNGGYPNGNYPGGEYPNQGGNYPGGYPNNPGGNYPGGGGYPNPGGNYPGGYPNNPGGNYPYPNPGGGYPGGGGGYPGGGGGYPGGYCKTEGSWCQEKVTPDRCMREEDLWSKCPRTCNTCQCADIDPKCINVQTDQRLCLDMRIKYLCRKSCLKCFSGIGVAMV